MIGILTGIIPSNEMIYSKKKTQMSKIEKYEKRYLVINIIYIIKRFVICRFLLLSLINIIRI